MIEVNEEPLLDLVRRVEQPFAEAEGHASIAGGYGPLDEWRLKDPVAEHLRGSENSHLHCGPRDKTVLYACSCGEPGCWPLMARITLGEATVTWTHFEQPHRRGRWDYSGFALTFERQQYESALQALA